MRELRIQDTMQVGGALSAGEMGDVAAVTGAALVPAVLTAAVQKYAPNILQNNIASVLFVPLATGLGAYTGLKVYHHFAD